ncbi:HTH-type transcriptional repressor RspR [Ralstonia condita]|uniref:HTH-type transcriptional repressor RspR n=1 Tax=Ralstonia condita TaxID=3058600 RepID=A0ABN9INY2_9RALS|nr:GntR family transcriptional regulator [Ralstonia sp. LMG 7141]CAJ0788723.1 HTH-type transcriptional repressor RspR [Ralstonia sp. LMG 7141]
MTPETIASELRGELMTGVLRPGTDLSQVELAQRFGVSRIPIRDALRILAGEGLVEIEVNRGAKTISLTPGEVREIYDLRILLECDCLQRAAAAMTPDALKEIDRVRLKSDLDAGGPDWADGDWAFHRTIYQLAGRQRQLAMIEALRRTCVLFISAYATMPVKKPRWLSEHDAIVKHLTRGETEQAVRRLQGHLEGAATHLLACMTASLG